jgi:uncharacterized protein YecT (DUF1311 family)
MKSILMLVLVLSVGSTFGQGTKKPAPCSEAGTQVEMNECAAREYKAADAALNRVYQQLVTKQEAEDKAALKVAQTAWLKYRDTNCAFVADQYKGGTIRPMIYALCLADMTRNRTAEIGLQIEDRNN